MKLTKALTGVKGYEQLDLGESLLDHGRDRGAKLFKPLPRLGRDQNRLRVTHPQLEAILLAEQIHLVHHQQARR